MSVYHRDNFGRLWAECDECKTTGGVDGSTCQVCIGAGELRARCVDCGAPAAFLVGGEPCCKSCGLDDFKAREAS